jgi:hypothetical protein
VQTVDASIYKASYPIWIFSLQKFRNILGRAANFQEFDGFENGVAGYLWKGFITGFSKVP